MFFPIASTRKIAFHFEKLTSYLRGEPIFPATLEIDITSECNRECPKCPSSMGSRSFSLTLSFIQGVFQALEGQTKGLLMTGGEPTLAPDFPKVMEMGRRYGFEEIAVVTNGSLLDKDKVTRALIEHGSVVRVSLYDWNKGDSEWFLRTQNRIEALRKLVDQEKSNLKIGVSALTLEENESLLMDVAISAKAAGAHWIYFHPTCTNWEGGHPLRTRQGAVQGRLQEISSRDFGDFTVSYYRERYTDEELSFHGYHAANFLLVIGADGKNYLGAEVKYNPDYVVPGEVVRKGKSFFQSEDRIKYINGVTSKSFAGIGSRHRGALYSHFIEALKNTAQEDLEENPANPETLFSFPHIL